MIKFHRPYKIKESLLNLTESLATETLAGDGPFTKKCSRWIKDNFGARHCLLTTSGTHSIELVLRGLDIGPGDEVISPSFTFISTANAIISVGATPVFAEITEDTLTIDPLSIERKITKATKAVIVVHYAGISADMDPILNLARKNSLVVIEDAAQGVGAKYKGKFLGTLGEAGCYSFHESKVVTCGEGGALVTNNDTLFNRCELIREKGTDKAAFMRGEVPKYTWREVGSSYLLSDLLSAMLLSQLVINRPILYR